MSVYQSGHTNRSTCRAECVHDSAAKTQLIDMSRAIRTILNTSYSVAASHHTRFRLLSPSFRRRALRFLIVASKHTTLRWLLPYSSLSSKLGVLCLLSTIVKLLSQVLCRHCSCGWLSTCSLQRPLDNNLRSHLEGGKSLQDYVQVKGAG